MKTKDISKLRVQRIGPALRKSMLNFNANIDIVSEIIDRVSVCWDDRQFLCHAVKKTSMYMIKETSFAKQSDYVVNSVAVAQAAILASIQMQLEGEHTVQDWLHKKGYAQHELDEHAVKVRLMMLEELRKACT